MQEPWPRIYREAPEVFAAFRQAEDPEGRIPAQLRRCLDLGGRRILELGAGTGKLAEALAPGCAAWIALEPEAGLLAQGRWEAALPVRGLGQRLPLRDASVDHGVAAWVLGYLPPLRQARVVAEALRVLRPGGSLWAVENGAGGDFQALRGVEDWEPGTARLLEDLGFEAVARVATELRFPSAEAAEGVLGALCGEAVRQRLQARPQAIFSHTVAILQVRA